MYFFHDNAFTIKNDNVAYSKLKTMEIDDFSTNYKQIHEDFITKVFKSIVFQNTKQKHVIIDINKRPILNTGVFKIRMKDEMKEFLKSMASQTGYLYQTFD